MFLVAPVVPELDDNAKNFYPGEVQHIICVCHFSMRVKPAWRRIGSTCRRADSQPSDFESLRTRSLAPIILRDDVGIGDDITTIRCCLSVRETPMIQLHRSRMKTNKAINLYDLDQGN